MPYRCAKFKGNQSMGKVSLVENGELAVPVNNTLVCHTAFSAADT